MSDTPCVDGCGQDAATIERLRAERDEWRRECERWRDEAGVDGPFDALVAERDALRERAAKVEALLEGVDEGNLKTSHIRAVLETSIADDYERGRVHAEDDAYRRLRAALSPQDHPRSAVDAPEEE